MVCFFKIAILYFLPSRIVLYMQSKPISSVLFRSFVPLWLTILLLSATISSAQNVTGRIKINQLGYYTSAPKIAIVTGTTDAHTFFITSTNIKDTLFTGTLSEEKQSVNSSTKTKVADFSALKKKGTFVVFVPGVGLSYVFEIGDKINYPAAVAGLKGFYFQRASMPLEEKYAGKWHRSSGHADTAVFILQQQVPNVRQEQKFLLQVAGTMPATTTNTLSTAVSAWVLCCLLMKTFQNTLIRCRQTSPKATIKYLTY